jgi:hypothetical protein
MVTGNEPHLLQIEFRDADRRQYMRVRIPSLPGVTGAEAVESYVSQQPILPIEVLGGSWGHLTDPLKRYSAPVRLSTFDLTSLDLIWFREKNRLFFVFRFNIVRAAQAGRAHAAAVVCAVAARWLRARHLD